MKKLFLLLLIIPTITWANSPSTSPVGYWKTIGDVSKKPRSIIKIWLNKGILFGKIVNGFPVDGKRPKAYCLTCPEQFHNQRIIGLTMMWGYHQDKSHPNKWTGGEVLDPLAGEIYHSYLEINPDGKSLKIRGYIGIPLIGRSQTWYRLDQKQYHELMQQFPVAKLPASLPTH